MFLWRPTRIKPTAWQGLCSPNLEKKNQSCALAFCSATKVLCAEVGIIATKFSQRLNASATEESDFVNASITNVYLEVIKRVDV
jgi:hypothetical protein